MGGDLHSSRRAALRGSDVPALIDVWSTTEPHVKCLEYIKQGDIPLDYVCTGTPCWTADLLNGNAISAGGNSLFVPVAMLWWL